MLIVLSVEQPRSPLLGLRATDVCDPNISNFSNRLRLYECRFPSHTRASSKKRFQLAAATSRWDSVSTAKKCYTVIGNISFRHIERPGKTKRWWAYLKMHNVLKCFYCSPKLEAICGEMSYAIIVGRWVRKIQMFQLMEVSQHRAISQRVSNCLVILSRKH